MSKFGELSQHLLKKQYCWLITGAAGFIGSNLLEKLLLLNQKVIGLDNLSTGYNKNLLDVKETVDSSQWKNFSFIEGDIRSFSDCKKACESVDFVLHQAALGSVPRSFNDPLTSNAVNIDGFLNMLVASKESEVKSFVYASSSSVYGDHESLPKVEGIIGKQLSPYAITKYVNELYANNFSENYDLKITGLRYFNVFGKRQDPNGSYAAVIPKWINSILKREPIYINGDGTTSRDFCFIENVTQVNILATLSNTSSNIYNVAVGDKTSLNTLQKLLYEYLAEIHPIELKKPIYRDFRVGDVKHSLADIRLAKIEIGYSPEYSIEKGLKKSLPWYVKSILSN